MIKPALLPLLALLALPPLTRAQPSEHTGLAVGQKAPLFTLQDQNGKAVSLESMLKNGKVALVFFRSADW